MRTKFEIRGKKGYHILTLDGNYVGSFWGVAEVTGKEVGEDKQVTINGSDAFLWVNEIKVETEEEK